jgi:hypothetical protein
MSEAVALGRGSGRRDLLIRSSALDAAMLMSAAEPNGLASRVAVPRLGYDGRPFAASALAESLICRKREQLILNVQARTMVHVTPLIRCGHAPGPLATVAGAYIEQFI